YNHVAHPPARVDVEGVEHLIDEEPGRRVNDGPRKCQTLLLSVAQDTVPASELIEHRHQAIQAEPLERMRERLGTEVCDRRGVSENLAQRAGRQIGGARDAQHRLADGKCDAARAPWPEACERPEQLAGPCLADDL